jgi:hypothetical protein
VIAPEIIDGGRSSLEELRVDEKAAAETSTRVVAGSNPVALHHKVCKYCKSELDEDSRDGMCRSCLIDDAIDYAGLDWNDDVRFSSVRPRVRKVRTA